LPSNPSAHHSSELNLLSPFAFYWLKVLAVAETEQLPAAQARAGEPTAWNTFFRRCQLPLSV
jgi:hypothetical protein